MEVQGEFHLEFDNGGAVYPIDWCPHLASSLKDCAHQDFLLSQLSGLSKDKTAPCVDCEEHNSVENWLCLTCGVTLCSRYQKGHGLSHFEQSCQGKEDPEDPPHCVHLSFSDLSVWCHCCDSYIKHNSLLKILVYAEAAKFGTTPKLHLLAPAGAQEPIQEGEEEEGQEAGF
eukprot:GSChrysophyteH2.ASY1.ANO1.1738.1 assembled CDS